MRIKSPTVVLDKGLAHIFNLNRDNLRNFNIDIFCNSKIKKMIKFLKKSTLIFFEFEIDIIRVYKMKEILNFQ